MRIYPSSIKYSDTWMTIFTRTSLTIGGTKFSYQLKTSVSLENRKRMLIFRYTIKDKITTFSNYPGRVVRIIKDPTHRRSFVSCRHDIVSFPLTSPQVGSKILLGRRRGSLDLIILETMKETSVAKNENKNN